MKIKKDKISRGCHRTQQNRNKEKVEGVLSWPEPKNVKDIRKFLDLANYYRRFIKDFSQVARPMNMLKKKDIKWQ